MADTLRIDARIMEKIEIKKNLIELQNSKRARICEISESPIYLHSLITQKDPEKIKEIREKIDAVIYMIQTQQNMIDRARKEGMAVSRTISTAIGNELVVCNEIKEKFNNIPKLVEKIEELDRKIHKTMAEIRIAEMDNQI